MFSYLYTTLVPRHTMRAENNTSVEKPIHFCLVSWIKHFSTGYTKYIDVVVNPFFFLQNANDEKRVSKRYTE